jgi:hypothetical protein
LTTFSTSKSGISKVSGSKFEVSGRSRFKPGCRTTLNLKP